MSASLPALRATVAQAIGLLFESGVMQPSGHGNFSVRLDDERMLITSTGGLRGVTADDLAVVTFDGQVLEGRIDPNTAEIVAMHAGVYRARDDLRAVVHTHSPHATAFALAHEPLPCAYESLLRFGLAEPVPIAAWAPRGSPESVTNIVEQVLQHPTTPAVLLANHGLLAFGTGPLEAARLVVILEEAAMVTLRARQLGGAQPFPPGALAWEQRRMAEFRARALHSSST